MPWNDIKSMYNSYSFTQNANRKVFVEAVFVCAGRRMAQNLSSLNLYRATLMAVWESVCVCACVCNVYAQGIYESSVTYTIRLNVMRYEGEATTAGEGDGGGG